MMKKIFSIGKLVEKFGVGENFPSLKSSKKEFKV